MTTEKSLSGFKKVNGTDEIEDSPTTPRTLEVPEECTRSSGGFRTNDNPIRSKKVSLRMVGRGVDIKGPLNESVETSRDRRYE